jgi:hypothetical protein
LVKAIKVDDEHVRITYRVSPRPFASGPSGGQIRQHCLRRVERPLRGSCPLATSRGARRLGGDEFLVPIGPACSTTVPYLGH